MCRYRESIRQINRPLRLECKHAKEDQYNHLCAEIEELDKQVPQPNCVVKSMERKTKIKLGGQNKEGYLRIEPALILDRWFEYIGDGFEDEKPIL